MPATAHEAALDLYKSAVELEVKLRQLLKQKQPFDKEVATVRSKLRDNYEKIIFLDYDLAYSKDVEQNLWKYVFYKVIEEFRTRIRLAQSNPGGIKSPVTRKLSTSFRSFLHEATGFYYSFIQRLASHFQLEEINPFIKNFGLFSGPSVPEAIPMNFRQRAILSCHKSLIFLGDLARYREMQNERPRKNWATVREYYNQARQLVPDSGNPHNQLAVIASYNSDDFAAVYHYYRSLVVRNPFLTAKDNLGFLFQKAKKGSADFLESNIKDSQNGKFNLSHRHQALHKRQLSSGKLGLDRPKTGELLEMFFAEFVRLHGILYLKSDVEIYPTIKTSFLEQLKKLAFSRFLDSDQLLSIVVINIAALFVIRHINNENGDNNINIAKNSAYSQSSKKALIEKYALLLVVDTFSALLNVCNSELADVSETALGQTRTAVQVLPAAVKRILATLRIATKWLNVSLEYLAFMSSIIGNDKNIRNQHSSLINFWESYTEFLNSLERLFPHKHGVPLEVPLHEDFEMHGFLALKNEITLETQALFDQDGPFEEHDMRIYDIVEDAYKIADSKISLLYLVEGIFTASKPSSPPMVSLVSQTEVEDEILTEDDMEIPNETHDTIVDHNENDLVESQSFTSSSPKVLAGDNNEDDDDDEVILFTGRHQSWTENRPASFVVGDKRPSPHSSLKNPNQITAEELLNQVLNGNLSTPSNGKSTEKPSFWNHFNTPQIFGNNISEHQNTTSPLGSTNNMLNLLDSSSAAKSGANQSNGSYTFSPFSPSATHTSGVPNSSQDPVVSTTNFHKGGSDHITSNRTSTAPSSASLFAFPGLDSEFNKYDLFPIGSTNPSNKSFGTTTSTLTSLNGTVMPTRSLNPPPGFPSVPIGFGLSTPIQHINRTHQPIIPQTRSSYGFSPFEVDENQLPQEQSGFQMNLNQIL
ncbi:hypothetical protein G9A89_022177 [Geosiphon pyriformis]|nr:hypothetical protein G9A89_022177 [Geosiphon pyriformis]